MKLTQKTDSKSSQQQTAMNGKAMEWCKNKVLKFVKKSFFFCSAKIKKHLEFVTKHSKPIEIVVARREQKLMQCFFVHSTLDSNVLSIQF